MDKFNTPNCSHDAEMLQEGSQPLTPVEVNQTTPINDHSNSNVIYQSSDQRISINIKMSNEYNIVHANNHGTSLIIETSLRENPIIHQPRTTNLHASVSLIMTNPQSPQSLFLQALSKLNATSNNFSVINYLQANMDRYGVVDWKSGDLTPPGSLTSAPPSYSFVLRQMAARRRPRLMGTFFPSPSFVQQTPPPTYGTAFDIYIDPGSHPPHRVLTYGFTSMPVVCPECGFTGLTITTSKVTICTHLCALLLCLFCCWICVPLPYVLRSCKDVYHYCRNCRNYLGMYCPTNPEHPMQTG